MPILHTQITAQAQTPSGQAIPVLPSVALQTLGPLVQVTVGPAQSLIDQWTQQGIPIPATLAGTALIDTGAVTTCIDDRVAQQLGLPVIDVVPMASASGIGMQNVYPIQVIVAGRLTFGVERAMGAALGAHNIVALIGRDVLQMCTLHYNGPSGEFTLAI